MRFLKFTLLLVLFVWPVSLAVPSVPDRPIFEYNGDGEITFFNTHTNELLKVIYKDHRGHQLEKGLEDIYYILRCRLTGEETSIHPRLIELVDYIQDHFGADRIEVISGYRSPSLNGTLRAMGRRVARRSYHINGMAIDIRIPGVPTRELMDYAVSLKAGGVGYYSGPDFVHIDIGPVRHW